MAQTPDDAPRGAPDPVDDRKDGPLDTLAEEARARVARATVEAAAEAAVATAGKVATSVLDGLETLLFGRVGGAEAAAKADDGDALTRLRTRYNADVAAVKREAGEPEGSGPAPAAARVPGAPPGAAAPPASTAGPAKPDPVARARAELEALKAARGKRPDPPIKKTL